MNRRARTVLEVAGVALCVVGLVAATGFVLASIPDGVLVALLAVCVIGLCLSLAESRKNRRH